MVMLDKQEAESTPSVGNENRCRLALLCTPRTGNTWLRHLLCATFELDGQAIVNPEEYHWEKPPERALVAIHWRRKPEFERTLDAAGFKIIVLARHPLDVLISIFRFAKHSRSCDRWLEGQGGSEASLVNAVLGDREFVEYATSVRARELLGVSLDWWQRPDALRLRYEDLVADTIGSLERLSAAIEQPPRRPIDEVLVDFDTEQMRTVQSQHVWRGRSGEWRQFLPPGVAREIAEAHALSFVRFGYDCEPDANLTAPLADARWLNAEAELLWKQTKSTHRVAVAIDDDVSKLKRAYCDMTERTTARDRAVNAHLLELEARIAATYAELSQLKVHLEESSLVARACENESALAAQRLEFDRMIERLRGIEAGLDRLAATTTDVVESRFAKLDSDPRLERLQTRIAALEEKSAGLLAQGANAERRLEDALAISLERLDAVCRHLSHLDDWRAQLGDIGPRGLSIARGVHGLANRHPKIANLVRRWTGRRKAA